MELSMAMVSQLCVLGATGVAAVFTMVGLCNGRTVPAAPRTAGHGRARRR